MKIIYKTHIDAAHHLPNYKGKCRIPHGHTWEVVFEFSFKGKPPEPDGFYVDFRDIKDLIGYYLQEYDHIDLNSFIPNPTAEHLAIHLWNRIKPNFKPLTKIQVWESANCGVEYSGEEGTYEQVVSAPV